MTEKQMLQLERKYNDDMESAGMMTGRKLKKLIALNSDLQNILTETADQKKGVTSVKTDDIRNRTGTGNL